MMWWPSDDFTEKNGDLRWIVDRALQSFLFDQPTDYEKLPYLRALLQYVRFIRNELESNIDYQLNSNKEYLLVLFQEESICQDDFRRIMKREFDCTKDAISVQEVSSLPLLRKTKGKAPGSGVRDISMN